MKRDSMIGAIVAEFIGTMLLIIMGDGVVAQVVYQTRGVSDWNTIVWGWGLAVAMAVYVAGGITGAHINPAVTFANMVVRGMKWLDGIVWMVAQIAGAFVGAFIVWVWYNGSFATSGNMNVFFTAPANANYTLLNSLFSEIMGTLLLLLFIAAIVDNIRNLGPGSNLWPFMVGMAVLAIGLSVGGPTGYAINPARDFGPRLFAAVAGMSSDFVTFGTVDAGYVYWWIPIVGPLIGGVLGLLVYDYILKPFLPRGPEASPAE